ncbi:MAG: VCBS repeat-containing protein [Ignavibacteria bacterium]
MVAHSICAADFDLDGYADILAATGNEIAWFQNLTNGNFGTKKQIASSLQSVVSVTTADIDNDGDSDILSASFGDNKIHWFENTDGNGSFSPQKLITNNALGARAVFAADLANKEFYLEMRKKYKGG